MGANGLIIIDTILCGVHDRNNYLLATCRHVGVKILDNQSFHCRKSCQWKHTNGKKGCHKEATGRVQQYCRKLVPPCAEYQAYKKMSTSYPHTMKPSHCYPVLVVYRLLFIATQCLPCATFISRHLLPASLCLRHTALVVAHYHLMLPSVACFLLPIDHHILHWSIFQTQK